MLRIVILNKYNVFTCIKVTWACKMNQVYGIKNKTWPLTVASCVKKTKTKPSCGCP